MKLSDIESLSELPAWILAQVSAVQSQSGTTEQVEQLVYRAGLHGGAVARRTDLTPQYAKDLCRSVVSTAAVVTSRDGSSEQLEQRLLQVFAEAIDQAYAQTQQAELVTQAAERRRLAQKYQSDIWTEDRRGNKKINQVAAAECLLQEIRIVVVDSGVRKHYYAYDGRGCWLEVSRLHVESIALKILGDEATESMAASVVRVASMLREFDGERFNNYPYKINLANGAYDLERFVLEEHSDRSYFTYRNNYHYDREATCPFTDEMVATYACGDRQWVDAFWEIAGWCLTSPYIFNKMSWWVGDGANGKSTCQRLLRELVGPALTKTGFQVDDLNKDFFLTSVIGKRLALCGDAAVRMTNMDRLKQYTGGDALETNVKFGAYKQFDNTAKLVLCMNRPPLVSSLEALKPIVRRILWLPFDYKIKNPDPTVEDRMLAEMPGIFNRAVQGLQRLRSQGRFTDVERGRRACELWTGQASSLNAYVDDNIVVDEQGSEWLSTIWENYRKWMDQHSGRYWESDQYNVRQSQQLSRELQARFSVRLEKEIDKRWSNDKNAFVRGTYAKVYGLRLRREDEFITTVPQVADPADSALEMEANVLNVEF